VLDQVTCVLGEDAFICVFAIRVRVCVCVYVLDDVCWIISYVREMRTRSCVCVL